MVEEPNPEAFLTEHPLDILLSGNYNKVPIMLGYNSREGIMMELVKKQTSPIIHHRLRDFEKAVPYYYNLEKGSDLSKYVAKKVEQFYYSKSKTPRAIADSFYLVSIRKNFSANFVHAILNALITVDSPIRALRLCDKCVFVP